MTVGCFWMNDEMAPADSIITPTAITTATIMTVTDSAMPTAVMTESSEKTMSSSRIWKMTDPNDICLAPASAWASSPSSLLWISCVAL